MMEDKYDATQESADFKPFGGRWPSIEELSVETVYTCPFAKLEPDNYFGCWTIRCPDIAGIRDHLEEWHNLQRPRDAKYWAWTNMVKHIAPRIHRDEIPSQYWSFEDLIRNSDAAARALRSAESTQSQRVPSWRVASPEPNVPKEFIDISSDDELVEARPVKRTRGLVSAYESGDSQKAPEFIPRLKRQETIGSTTGPSQAFSIAPDDAVKSKEEPESLKSTTFQIHDSKFYVLKVIDSQESPKSSGLRRQKEFHFPRDLKESTKLDLRYLVNHIAAIATDTNGPVKSVTLRVPERASTGVGPQEYGAGGPTSFYQLASPSRILKISINIGGEAESHLLLFETFQDFAESYRLWTSIAFKRPGFDWKDWCFREYESDIIYDSPFALWQCVTSQCWQNTPRGPENNPVLGFDAVKKADIPSLALRGVRAKPFEYENPKQKGKAIFDTIPAKVKTEKAGPLDPRPSLKGSSSLDLGPGASGDTDSESDDDPGSSDDIESDIDMMSSTDLEDDDDALELEVEDGSVSISESSDGLDVESEAADKAMKNEFMLRLIVGILKRIRDNFNPCPDQSEAESSRNGTDSGGPSDTGSGSQRQAPTSNDAPTERPSGRKQGNQSGKRKRKTTGDDTGGDEDGGSRRKQRKVNDQTPEEEKFACPFAKGRPQENHKCWYIRRKTVHGIREHMVRGVHKIPRKTESSEYKTWEALFINYIPEWPQEKPPPSPYFDADEVAKWALQDLLLRRSQGRRLESSREDVGPELHGESLSFQPSTTIMEPKTLRSPNESFLSERNSSSQALSYPLMSQRFSSSELNINHHTIDRFDNTELGDSEESSTETLDHQPEIQKPTVDNGPLTFEDTRYLLDMMENIDPAWLDDNWCMGTSGGDIIGHDRDSENIFDEYVEIPPQEASLPLTEPNPPTLIHNPSSSISDRPLSAPATTGASDTSKLFTFVTARCPFVPGSSEKRGPKTFQFASYDDFLLRFDGWVSQAFFDPLFVWSRWGFHNMRKNEIFDNLEDLATDVDYELDLKGRNRVTFDLVALDR